MNKRFVKICAIASLALVGVTLACANGQNLGGDPRATIVPARPPVHEVAQTTTLAGTGTGPATATCPRGEVALGGGWELPSPANLVNSQASLAAGASPLSPEGRVFAAKLNGNTWEVSVSHRPLRVTKNIPVTAYVECLAGTSGVVTTGTLSPSATLNPAQSLIEQTGCNPLTDGLTVGYGFDIDGAGVELYGISPLYESTPVDVELDIYAINHDSVAHVLHGYSYCLANVAASPDYLFTPETAINAGASGSSVASCLPGETVVGGGVHYLHVENSRSYVGNLFSMKVTPTGWRADVYAESNSGVASVAESASSMCLSFSHS
jgi:hypothetical protein